MEHFYLNSILVTYLVIALSKVVLTFLLQVTLLLQATVLPGMELLPLDMEPLLLVTEPLPLLPAMELLHLKWEWEPKCKL